MKNVEVGSYVKYQGGIGRVMQVVTKGGARLSGDEIVVFAKDDNPVVILKVYAKNDGIMIPTNRRVIKNVSSLEKVNAISKSEVKEVSKMDSDIIVVDEIEKGDFYPGSDKDSQVNPEPSALPVVENEVSNSSTVKAVEVEIEDVLAVNAVCPLTSNLYPGLVVPIPKLPPNSFEVILAFAFALKRGIPEISPTVKTYPVFKSGLMVSNWP